MLKTQLIRVLRPQIFYHSWVFPFSQKEVYDLRKPDNKSNKKYLMTSSPTRTMIIHPIFFPKFPFIIFWEKFSYQKSDGPIKELYLAEEAIGLAKSLSWTVSIFMFNNFLIFSMFFLFFVYFSCVFWNSIQIFIGHRRSILEG